MTADHLVQALLRAARQGSSIDDAQSYKSFVTAFVSVSSQQHVKEESEDKHQFETKSTANSHTGHKQPQSARQSEVEDLDPVAEVSRVLSNEQLPCLTDKCKAFVEAVAASQINENSPAGDLIPVFEALDSPEVMKACGLQDTDTMLSSEVSRLSSLDGETQKKEELLLIKNNRSLFDKIILKTPYLEANKKFKAMIKIILVWAKKKEAEKIQRKLESLIENPSLAYCIYRVVLNSYPDLPLSMAGFGIDPEPSYQAELDELELLSQSESECSDYVEILLTDIKQLESLDSEEESDFVIDSIQDTLVEIQEDEEMMAKVRAILQKLSAFPQFAKLSAIFTNTATATPNTLLTPDPLPDPKKPSSSESPSSSTHEPQKEESKKPNPLPAKPAIEEEKKERPQEKSGISTSIRNTIVELADSMSLKYMTIKALDEAASVPASIEIILSQQDNPEFVRAAALKLEALEVTSLKDFFSEAVNKFVHQHTMSSKSIEGIYSILKEPIDVEEVAQAIFDITQDSAQLGKAAIDLCKVIVPKEAAVIRVLVLRISEHLKVKQVKVDCPEIAKELPLLKDWEYERQEYEQQEDKRREYNVEDFLAVHNNFQIEEAIKKLKEYYGATRTLLPKLLVKILLHLVKGRQNFSKLVSEITEVNEDSKITKTVLFNYLLLHSSSDLRVLLFISCAQFMAVPIFSWDYWSLSTEQVEGEQQKDLPPPKRVFWKENFYVFESSRSVVNLKISLTGNSADAPQGISSFVNEAFGKEFKEHSDSIADQGTIELQYDFNCQNTEHLVVGDVHGCLEERELSPLGLIFDHVILHVQEDGEESSSKHPKLLATISALRTHNSEMKILVIAHSPKKASTKKESLSTHVTLLRFQNLAEMNSVNRDNMVRECQQHLLELFKIDVEAYKMNLELRLSRKTAYIAFLEAAYGLRRDTELAKFVLFEDLCRRLFEEIMSHDEYLTREFLPMLMLLKEQLAIEASLFRDDKLTQTERKQKQSRKGEIQNQMKTIKPSRINRLFTEAIQSRFLLGLSFFLTNSIKGVQEKKVMALIEKRTELRKQLNLAKVDKEQLESELLEVRDKILLLQFSLEMVPREIYQFSLQGSEQAQKEQRKEYQSYSQQQVAIGQPIELIDGNNLQFLSEIQALKDDNMEGDTLVVSVIGPQSAGKSLLMNFLFGTQFVTSAGRCTKGAYASVMKFRKEELKTDKNILLIDTEGIQSAEGRDSLFDRRITFFIMGVSHVALICNKGEMNAQMVEIIKLAADSIQNTKFDLIKNPEALIIMNMQAQINPNSASSCIAQLEEHFLKNNQEGKRTKLSITEDMVFTLKYAFDRKTCGPREAQKTVNSPSEQFTLSLQPIRNKILKRFDDIAEQKTTKIKMGEWLKKAKEFWNFTSSFTGFIDYKTLTEKKQDRLLLNFISEMHAEAYVSPSIAKSLEEEYSSLMESQGSRRFEVLCSKMKAVIQEEYTKILNETTKNYQSYCDSNQVSETLFFKRKVILTQCNSMKAAQQVRHFNEKISKYLEGLSTVTGNEFMNEFAENQVCQGKGFNKQSAQAIFDQAWKQAIDKVEEVIPSQQQVKKAVSEAVQSHFKNRFIQKISEDKQVSQEVQESFELGLFSKAEKQLVKAMSLVCLVENPNLPASPDMVKNFKGSKSNFLKVPDELVNESNRFEYFKWKDLIKRELEFRMTLDYQMYSIVGSLFQQFAHSDNRHVSILEPRDPHAFNEKMKEFNKELEVLGLRFKPLEINSKDIFLPLQFEEASEDLNSLKEELKRNKYGQKLLLSGLANQEDFEAYIKDLLRPMFQDWESYECIGGPDKDKFDEFMREHRRFKLLNLDGEVFHNIAEKYVVLSESHQDQDGWHKLDEKRMKVQNSEHDEFFKTNEAFQKFLDWLLDTSRTQPTQTEMKDIKANFFNLVDWPKVFHAIGEAIVKSCRVDAKAIGAKDYHFLANDMTLELAKEYVETNEESFSRVCDQMVSIFEKLNKDLQTFCMEVSTEGENYLLVFAQAVLSQLSFKLDNLKFRMPLAMFEKSKERERRLFVAKLTKNDSEADSSLAAKVIEGLYPFFLQSSKTKIRKDFE